MMIQPMFVVFAVADSSKTECVESQLCQGCGCCEVTRPSEQCCCCSSAEESTSKSDKPAAERSADASALGICLCGLGVPPMDRGERTPVRIIVRHIELFRLSTSRDDALRPPGYGTGADRLLETIQSPGYSQRFLCVWRI